MTPHKPVMLDEVLSALAPAAGEVHVDGTFGAGGYTRAILEAAPCTVVAIDRDPEAIDRAEALKREFGERFIFLRGCFGDVRSLLEDAGLGKVDGFVLDIGVSSMQIDQAVRGFSFRFDGPLDMRMDTASGGKTAADLVNELPEEELANLIYQYGEERNSRKVARRIAEARMVAPIRTTGQLAEIVRAALPRSPRDKIDSATRTFQALRIAVNDELGELSRALDASADILDDGGRLVVVSFHSLEDALVKEFMRTHAEPKVHVSRYAPAAQTSVAAAPFRVPVRKAVKPTAAEEKTNPRARSARLRYAVRTDAPGGREAA